MGASAKWRRLLGAVAPAAPVDQHRVWERIADSFDASRRRTWPHVEAFLGALPRTARVLDLMCGNGRHLGAARDAGLDCVGLDWSRGLAEAASKRGDVVVGDATRLPFADARFDAAIFVAGLHGLPKPAGRAASLRELRRVLRPGAQAQITVWSRDAPRFADLPRDRMDVVVPWRSGGLDEERTYHLYSPASLRAAVEGAGFDVVAETAVAIAAPAPGQPRGRRACLRCGSRGAWAPPRPTGLHCRPSLDAGLHFTPGAPSEAHQKVAVPGAMAGHRRAHPAHRPRPLCAAPGSPHREP